MMRIQTMGMDAILYVPLKKDLSVILQENVRIFVGMESSYLEKLATQEKMMFVLSCVDQLKKDTIALSMRIKNQHALRKVHRLLRVE